MSVEAEERRAGTSRHYSLRILSHLASPGTPEAKLSAPITSHFKNNRKARMWVTIRPAEARECQSIANFPVLNHRLSQQPLRMRARALAACLLACSAVFGAASSVCNPPVTMEFSADAGAWLTSSYDFVPVALDPCLSSCLPSPVPLVAAYC